MKYPVPVPSFFYLDIFFIFLFFSSSLPDRASRRHRPVSDLPADHGQPVQPGRHVSQPAGHQGSGGDQEQQGQGHPPSQQVNTICTIIYPIRYPTTLTKPTSRLTLSQIWSFKIRLTMFLTCRQFWQSPDLEALSCERTSRALRFFSVYFYLPFSSVASTFTALYCSNVSDLLFFFSRYLRAKLGPKKTSSKLHHHFELIKRLKRVSKIYMEKKLNLIQGDHVSDICIKTDEGIM